MGRRSSRPSGGRRPAPRAAPSRSSSTSARRAASPPPARSNSTAPAKQQKGNAPPPATAQAKPQQGSAMGGFMANVASTGLGVMAGRAMDRAFFGGSGESAPPAEAVATDQPYEYADESVPETVCAREAMEFQKCMQRTSSNVTECQWNIDILAACQRQHQENNGFADAARL